MRDYDIIAIDGEMSGSDVTQHALLSIGCVRVSDMNNFFYEEIKHTNLVVAPEALRVNKLEISQVDREGLKSAEEVDIELVNWLQGSPFYKEKCKYTVIPMGFNVGCFDMPFVRKFLPKSASIFGNRSLDLNALLFADGLKHGSRFKNLKHAAKLVGKAFASHYVPNLLPHHALYDAYVAIGVLEYIIGDLSKAGSPEIGSILWEGGAVSTK